MAVLVLAVVALGLVAPSSVEQPDPLTGRGSGRATASLAAALPEPAPDRGVDRVPLVFVENGGRFEPGIAFVASGPGHSFALTRDRVAMLLRPAGADAGDAVRLELRLDGADPGVRIEGTDAEPATINYVRGTDPAAWRTGLEGHHRVAYRGVWPGVDLHLADEGGNLKYEFHLAPGVDPGVIGLAYAGASGLTVDTDGALLVATPAGVLRDSAPISFQVVDGRRIAVPSAYRLEATTGRYGFTVGAHDPSRPLVIDPGIEYATFLGGTGHELGADIAVDDAGNVYLVGSTHSNDFPTAAAFDPTFNGGIVDVYVAKLRPDGSGLVYATYLGGTPTPLRRGPGDPVEHGRSVAVDGRGHAYIAGQTTSSDFPTTPGAFQRQLNVVPIETREDATDAFVAQLDAGGSLVYSTFLGGTNLDDADEIALDQAGNAYVMGRTGSTDFPTTADAHQPQRSGGFDGYIAVLDPAGAGLVHSTYLGGSDNETADGIVVVGPGEVVVAGSTRSADFLTTPGSFQPVHSGGAFIDLFEVFVTRIVLDGSPPVYSTFLGGTGREFAQGLAVDGSGSPYVTGGTLSADFDVTPGAFDTVFDPSSESFVTKLSPDGSSLVYSTFLGGGGSADLAVDASGRVWVVGAASAGAPTTADAASTTNAGSTDAWIARLDAAGAQLDYATFLGGSEADPGAAVAIGAGRVHVVGTTYSADFPVTASAFDATFGGDPLAFWGDAFVVRIDPGPGSEPPPPPPPPPPDPDPDPPPPTTETASFGGELRRNGTVSHTITVGAPGPVDLVLDWQRSRANLTVRVVDPNGQVTFVDTSSARPKVGSYATTAEGVHRVEITNTTRRDTAYTLAVTYPVAGSEEPPPPPPPPPAPTPTALAVSPSSVAGGATATGTVTLSDAAPAGGLVVDLASSAPAVAGVASTVTVAAGDTAATFAVTTSEPASDTTVVLTATAGGVSRTAALTVTAPAPPPPPPPPPPPETTVTLTVSPTIVDEGATPTGTVVLSEPAPAGGASVTLSSSDPAVAAVPAQVVVAAGATSASFDVGTGDVATDSSATLTATHAGSVSTAVLTVRDTTPPPPPPPPEADTVTISRAEYDAGKQELRVEATSSNGSATLTVTVTSSGQLIGTMSNGRGEFSWPVNPSDITVTSDQGGSATGAVESK